MKPLDILLGLACLLCPPLMFIVSIGDQIANEIRRDVEQEKIRNNLPVGEK